ncbi:very short patch repair endonuclease [Oleiphilus sp. HI0071]|uniref:very short patch repair endonuclease n=1 Tax=Oleiphilus sp. HI0080 TaxID=1822255 RepID=UPI0007C39BBB|nr:very short patch repair endonuclease [Oleiphilus sp. HI0080]KZY67169.1 very short patch repair endonuclease [Oleiphilus sp. HI0065]KZY82186.1 very short patch repair endonuclease [Oleiphilus sp. HI0071]KZY91956.1 very short patch repair endonuclease [Oleiphilus sp. HI0073]KZZ61559.1 very short patch repair endonuclease [Oleiphilus sp. HI0122]KZY83110.1 very short patch repair endonuclease [Oleiphilus sp. HI0071]
MTDIVSPAKRSEMMSGIKGKDTKPELIIRKGLHKRGFRFRLHDKRLPGKPDLVLPKYRTAIFVNGCFWHGHNCQLFKWPKSNPDFWREKITTTRKRDEQNQRELTALGWKVLAVWECDLRGKSETEIDRLIDRLAKTLKSFLT